MMLSKRLTSHSYKDNKAIFLAPLKRIRKKEDLEIHEDTTLRNGGKIEEPKEVEEIVKELDEQLETEEESASSKPKEKNEEVETILELPSEDIPYILEVEETMVPLHEIGKTSIVKKIVK